MTARLTFATRSRFILEQILPDTHCVLCLRQQLGDLASFRGVDRNINLETNNIVSAIQDKSQDVRMIDVAVSA